VALTVRVADGPEDRQYFADLVMEYETTLPPDLRHAEIGLSPQAAIIAFIDGMPCGCVALWDLDDAAIMKRLYVRSTFRNRGVARGLLEKFLAAARELGYRRIVLDTDRKRMPAAYALYRALGFEDCEPYGPVDYASPTFMELRL
jgi:GNAT superfamily N-acetyltransferase